jgi:hypothetical protein
MGDTKRAVRINRLFAIFPLSRSPFYQLNRCIWGERAIAISQLKDRFSPRCQCRPLAFITNEQRRKNNSEKRLGFDDFSVLLLTIFSIKLLSPSPTRDMGYLHPQTEFHHAAHATPYSKRPSRSRRASKFYIQTTTSRTKY